MRSVSLMLGLLLLLSTGCTEGMTAPASRSQVVRGDSAFKAFSFSNTESVSAEDSTARDFDRARSGVNVQSQSDRNLDSSVETLVPVDPIGTIQPRAITLRPGSRFGNSAVCGGYFFTLYVVSIKPSNLVVGIFWRSVTGAQGQLRGAAYRTHALSSNTIASPMNGYPPSFGVQPRRVVLGRSYVRFGVLATSSVASSCRWSFSQGVWI